MGKQGLMVFSVNCYQMPPHRAQKHMAKVKQDLEDMGIGAIELKDNYELMFKQGTGHDGIEITVFPYRDYKFSIENMTVGEIENWIQTEVLSKLQKP